jgi:Arc-like DNA binding domain
MPRKKVVEGKRYPLNMRTTKEMREKLERAATESGRSMVQEVEFRLERSFDREEISRRLDSFELRTIRALQPVIEKFLKDSGAEGLVKGSKKGATSRKDKA